MQVKRQRGISLIGLIIVIAILGVIGVLGMKIIPTMLEYRAILTGASPFTATRWSTSPPGSPRLSLRHVDRVGRGWYRPIVTSTRRRHP